MKICIIGATGMVGHVLFNQLRKENINLTGIGRRNIQKEIINFDLFTQWEQVKFFLQNEKFDIVINCSAILVNESNINRLRAVYINSLLPHMLVDSFKDTNTKIIHLSTGGVFSGEEEHYFEDSTLSPQTYYGITKAAGEFINEKDLVIRSDFWGPDNKKSGTGLFNWFLNQKGTVTGYTNVFFNGISNVEFARILSSILNLNGMVHIATNIKYSKSTFLEKTKKTFSLEKITLSQDKTVCKNIFLKSFNKIPMINDLDTMLHNVYQYLLLHRQYYADIYPEIYRG